MGRVRPWFIRRDSEGRGYAFMDKEGYRYVSKPTVDFLRAEYKHNRFAERAEYFTKVQERPRGLARAYCAASDDPA